MPEYQCAIPLGYPTLSRSYIFVYLPLSPLVPVALGQPITSYPILLTLSRTPRSYAASPSLSPVSISRILFHRISEYIFYRSSKLIHHFKVSHYQFS